MNIWFEIEREHYIFHFKENTLAETDKESIIELQEKCFNEITDALGFMPKNKIAYWLCESREEVMEVSGYEYPTNGVTYAEPDNPRIYAVYNERTKCIGYHEDVHAIMGQYSHPNSSAIIEGLAMAFDKTWWTVPNELCTYIYLEDKKYVGIAEMVQNDDFYDIADCISYPIMGAFTSYLLEHYDRQQYMQLYQEQEDWDEAVHSILGITLAELEREFIAHIQELHYSEEELEKARSILYDEA